MVGKGLIEIWFCFLATAVTVKFADSDYVVNEDQNPIPVILQKNARIATPLVLMVTPLNYPEFIDGGYPLPVDFPDVREFSNATCM